MKARISEILESFREFVTTHNYEETPILTAYVNIDPSDPANKRANPAWMIALKNEAKRLEAELDSDSLRRRDVQRKWTNTTETVMNYVRDRKPTGRSIALFSDHEDLLAVDLPVPVTTRLHYVKSLVLPYPIATEEFNSLIVDATLNGAEIEVVYREAADKLNQMGGLGATLYHKASPAPDAATGSPATA